MWDFICYFNQYRTHRYIGPTCMDCPSRLLRRHNSVEERCSWKWQLSRRMDKSLIRGYSDDENCWWWRHKDAALTVSANFWRSWRSSRRGCLSRPVPDTDVCHCEVRTHPRSERCSQSLRRSRTSRGLLNSREQFVKETRKIVINFRKIENTIFKEEK